MRERLHTGTSGIPVAEANRRWGASVRVLMVASNQAVKHPALQHTPRLVHQPPGRLCAGDPVHEHRRGVASTPCRSRVVSPRERLLALAQPELLWVGGHVRRIGFAGLGAYRIGPHGDSVISRNATADELAPADPPSADNRPNADLLPRVMLPERAPAPPDPREPSPSSTRTSHRATRSRVFYSGAVTAFMKTHRGGRPPEHAPPHPEHHHRRARDNRA